MFASLFQLEQKPVTVFSSADTGAPTLTTDIGSLKTLLKACLVTGYGAKQGLGWQMAFESTDKNVAAFKSADPTASGFYFKIDNSATGTATLTAFQEMTNGVGAKQINTNLEYQLKKSNWRLIGHSKAFVLLLDITGSYGKFCYPIFFGDLPREKKRIAPICAIWCGRIVTYSAGFQNAVILIKNGYYGSNNSAAQSTAYPLAVNDGSSSENIGGFDAACCRFIYNTFINSTSVLYEPMLMKISDGTWTIFPALLPASRPLTEVGNLNAISANALSVKTGDYQHTNADNTFCVVPTDWWYA